MKGLEAKPLQNETSGCQEWCIDRNMEQSSSAYSLNLYSAAIELCKICQGHSSDTKCKDIQFISDSVKKIDLTANSGKKNILQMGRGGEILVFQTDNNGIKDLEKPYLAFERELTSEDPVDWTTLGPSTAARIYTSRTKMSLRKANVETTIIREYTPSMNSLLNANKPEAVRRCATVELKTDSCIDKKLLSNTEFRCSVPKLKENKDGGKSSREASKS